MRVFSYKNFKNDWIIIVMGAEKNIDAYKRYDGKEVIFDNPENTNIGKMNSFPDENILNSPILYISIDWTVEK